MVDQLIGSFHIGGGHHQGINGSFAVQRRVQLVAHNFVAISVGNDAQIAESIDFSEVGDVAAPGFFLMLI